MQQFSLIHDGSNQGWQTAYQAFHVSALLGAPLQVLMVASQAAGDEIIQRGEQVKIGGRAAGLNIDTLVIPDVAPETIINHTPMLDGLFIPKDLVTNRQTAAGLLEALACPVWMVTQDSEMRDAAIVLGEPGGEQGFIASARATSQRLGASLTALIAGGAPSPGFELPWMSLADVSPKMVMDALDQLGASLLFSHMEHFSLLSSLNCTCVVYPPGTNT